MKLSATVFLGLPRPGPQYAFRLVVVAVVALLAVPLVIKEGLTASESNDDH